MSATHNIDSSLAFSEITPQEANGSVMNGKKRGYKKRKSPRRTGSETASKIGVTGRVAMKPASFLMNRLNRKLILRVPEDIREKHPDKHFAFVNYNKLQKQGGYHAQGYRLFKSTVDSGNVNREKFQENFDQYIHRNEMVLAWLPKEEFETRQEEERMYREHRDLSQAITNQDILKEFSPHADLKRQLMTHNQLMAEFKAQPAKVGG